jgi:hypothetical protein
MVALTRNPQNTNLLQPTKYLLMFDRIPDTQYFCQSINIPGITGSQIQVNSPGLDFYIAGNKMSYGNLNISFVLDEELLSWRNIHKWFRSFASPEGTNERNSLSAIENHGNSKSSSMAPYSDAVLTILTGLNNANFRVDFYNLFPVSLSDVQFDTRLSAEETMTADATFAFEYFNIVDIGPASSGNA